jgi:hypothetical protein
MVERYRCCNVTSDNQYNVALLARFKEIDENDLEKQKQFVSGLLSESCDDECYQRCFEISVGQYLCRSCLSIVLQLPRRIQKAIVPSARYISGRYRILCITEIFNALVIYRSCMLHKRPSRRDSTYNKRNIQWSHPCFNEAIKKINRIRTYRVHGIKHFASQTGIIHAINAEQIILGAFGDHRLNQFITSVNGCVIDMLSLYSQSDIVIDELYKIALNIPTDLWKRVSTLSMSHLDGYPIEYTSSSHASLSMWTIDHAKNCNHEILTMLHELEKLITAEISNFVHKSKEHVVRLQPGALRSRPGTVPQRAHRDFTINTYKAQLPGQVYIGFMPITRDGMFLQVWNGPGEAKLIFIPYGNFLLLPGNTIHAGWMCTSVYHRNHRLHFYIIVSKEPHKLTQKEDLFFENMNKYVDEESSDGKELFESHMNCLAKNIYKNAL